MTASVAIVISTCDRPTQLARLLDSLSLQEGADLPRPIPVFIADNGRRPVPDVVARGWDGLDIAYEQVPEPGLSAVRNRTIAWAREAGVDLIAMIDDDETAPAGWLAGLLAVQRREQADIVNGPVLPIPAEPMPQWLIDSKYFYWDDKRMGTCNLMLRVEALGDDPAGWFNPMFGESGGEDYELLHRMIREGARIAPASDEAPVHDHIPVERLRVPYFLRLAQRHGVLSAQLLMIAGRGRLWVFSRALWFVLSKLAYALDHLVRAPFGGRWHLVRGARDVVEVGAFTARFFGWQKRFYGRRARN